MSLEIPAGFLGTRADLLVDMGVLSIVAVVPVLWLFLIAVSLVRFPTPPLPTIFRSRRYWGRIGMSLMLGSGLTAIPMYILGFIYSPLGRDPDPCRSPQANCSTPSAR